MTYYLPSRDTSNTPSFPAISHYDGFEENTDNHKTLETSLDVSPLLLS